jgi:hypothetical protein
MLSHVADAIAMARGELACTPKRLPIRYFPLKQLIIYWLPFPKGAPTAVELMRQPQAEWQPQMAELRQQIEKIGGDGARTSWPEHPAFGRLTTQAWGVLVYRHLDHHLRQFGV